MPHNPALYQLLLNRLDQAPHQRLTFAEYMDLVLYHPQEGYYTARDSVIGPQGDFITSAHLGVDFGELIAAQVVECWHRLGQPTPFALVEIGAGQGLVTAALLADLEHDHPDCLEALAYQIVEKSEPLRAMQQRRLAPWAERVAWVSLDDLPDDTITGCFFSNELVDALPVHQVVLTTAGLQEIYVTLDGKAEGRIQEVVGPPSTPQLADYFDLVEVDFAPPHYAVGYRTEVHLAALDWMKSIAAKLHRGYVLTIDYGYPASRYYSRGRSQGTLQCYYQHAHHNDPYSHIGHQDITAHVNFTALERQGERCGLQTVGATPQAMFLMALGLGDRLSALAQIQSTDPDTLRWAMQRRDQLQQLINPMGLGNFMVLIQSKGMTALATQPLKGLTVPPLI
ncbi:MAG: class I SAM-dependent methyltransferase [Nodosilinea sp.]